MGDNCAGVSFEYSSYRLRTNLIFEQQNDTELWVKGQIWAENVVPRVEWEARDPVNVINFKYPAEVGVIGHHTAGRGAHYNEFLSNIQANITIFEFDLLREIF